MHLEHVLGIDEVGAVHAQEATPGQLFLQLGERAAAAKFRVEGPHDDRVTAYVDHPNLGDGYQHRVPFAFECQFVEHLACGGVATAQAVVDALQRTPQSDLGDRLD